MRRGGAISLIAICLFSASGCLPQAIIIDEQPTVPIPIREEGINREYEQEYERVINGEVINEEVDEEKRAWHFAAWNFAAKWGGFLWDKLLQAWGLTKEAGATAIEFGINYAAMAYEWGRPYAKGIIDVSGATLNSVTSSAAYQKTLDVLSNPGAFIDTYERLSRFTRNLDWSRVNPIPFMFRGTRGVPRPLTEAKLVWETIPIQIRAAGPEATARFLATRDWSHIYPYSLGGSNDALNGIFEERYYNRARGNAIMTPQEIRAAQAALRSNALQVTLHQATQGALRGGAISAGLLAAVAAMELGLQWQKGEITRQAFYFELGKTIGAAGVAGAAVSGLVTAMALAFPPLIPVVTVVSVPLAIVGFSLLTTRLIRAGKEWFQAFLQRGPLKPEALEYWLASYYGGSRDRGAVELVP